MTFLALIGHLLNFAAPALGVALLLFGSWQLVTLVDFTRGIFQRIPALFS